MKSLKLLEYPDIEDLKNAVYEYMGYECMIHKAGKLGLDKNIYYEQEIREPLERELVILFNKTILRESLPEITEERLSAFYNEHKESRYYKKGRAVLNVVRADTREKAEALAKKLQAFDSFRQSGFPVLIQSFRMDKDGEILPARQPDIVELGRYAFEMQSGERKGPVAFNHPEDGRQFALLECKERIQGGQLTFEQARHGSLEKDLVAYLKQKNEQKLLKDLRKKYTIRQYPEYLEQRLQESITKTSS
ncbi:MAG: peptidylprolyl isomerase [candidate division KSB1 bacterium]|nr:peptidylprolyl isomerase [candidate division KSB1 bacterium]